MYNEDDMQQILLQNECLKNKNFTVSKKVEDSHFLSESHGCEGPIPRRFNLRSGHKIRFRGRQLVRDLEIPISFVV
jgi:hypothetical protein